MTDEIVPICITIEDRKPAIWRSVEIPVGNSLK
ncbi:MULTISPECIES: plasmid pRiA4b ORF-3 family protein [Sphingopyxis]|nr:MULTISPECIES: plasmid pRiA4b ORF-3 family protein [Sphingopyxis]KGB56883.1 hypothetical protein FG95_02185 [Sphingopyxis sp. LC363]